MIITQILLSIKKMKTEKQPTAEVPQNGIAINGKNETPKEQPKQENPIQITTQMQRSVLSVFEKLQQGQKLQESYQNAKSRLEEIENFKSEFDGTGLEMTISNRYGDEVKFRHQESICNFIDNQLEHGKEVIGFMESKIIDFSI